jgi:type I restriction enzyme S subunit
MKNGWQTKKLGEVCDVDKRQGIYKHLPYVGLEQIESHTGRFIGSTEPVVVKSSTFKFSQEHVLYGRLRPYLNKVMLPDFAGHCSTEIFPLKPHPGLSREFLQYWFLREATVGQIDATSTGARMPRANMNAVLDFEFPLPPLPEQQRIVRILDEAFEGIAMAKANAEKNLQNARNLFESYLQSVFAQRGKDWDRLTLESLLERGWIESHLDGNHGGDYPRKEEFIREGVPYISANCIEDERVDMSRAKYLSPSRAALLRKGIARDNDVLFAHNATVGPVAILHTEEKKVILGTSLTYYRCNPKYILPEYLAHYMRSFGFKTQYLQVMRQSTRNQVPITKQREFFHVIPPLNEQKRIIGALDGLFENGQHLVSIYEQKLIALEALKKSLLNEAFTGKL